MGEGGGGGGTNVSCQLNLWPIGKIKGAHEGEKRVIAYEYIPQDAGASERIISHMSMRRSRHFMDAADDWVYSKVAITN